MSHPEPLLQLHDLRVDVAERHVLKSVSLTVPAGALLVLMGANGSGKSTLGLTLAGHPRYRVTGGTARFAGQDLLALSPQARARPGCSCRSRRRPRSPASRTTCSSARR
jgi:Fe-S cluster assembly ATP-binding protein